MSVHGEAATPFGATAPSYPIGGLWESFKSETKNIFENVIRSLNNNFIKTEKSPTYDEVGEMARKIFRI